MCIRDRYQNLGVSHIVLGNYDIALKYFNTSEKILLSEEKNRKNQEILAKNYGSKGIIFSEQNQYAKALDCLLYTSRCV